MGSLGSSAPSSAHLGVITLPVFLPSTVTSAAMWLLSLSETVAAREPVAMGYCLRISKTLYSANNVRAEYIYILITGFFKYCI